MNFLAETVEAITESGHSPAEIVFIGSEESGYCCTWDAFQRLANQEYDNDHGGDGVAQDLIIVFQDGQRMWRDAYDGAESWEYSRPFVAPHTLRPLQYLFCDRRPDTFVGTLCGTIAYNWTWDSLEELHQHVAQEPRACP